MRVEADVVKVARTDGRGSRVEASITAIHRMNQLPAPLIVCRITGSPFRYLVKAEPPMFAICAATDDGAVTATHNGPPPAKKSIS